MLQQRLVKTATHVGLSTILISSAAGCGNPFDLFSNKSKEAPKPAVEVGNSEDWQQASESNDAQGSVNLSSRPTFINTDCEEDPNTPRELLDCLNNSLARGFFEAEGANVDTFTTSNVLPKEKYKDWAHGEGLNHLGVSESQARDILGVAGETRTMTFRKVLEDGRTVLRTTPVVLVDGTPTSLDQLNINELFWGIVFKVNNVTKVAFIEDRCENPMGLIITITPAETPAPTLIPTSQPTPEFSATPQTLPSPPSTPTREASATPQTNPLTSTPIVPSSTAVLPTSTIAPTREVSATPQTNPLTSTPIGSGPTAVTGRVDPTAVVVATNVVNTVVSTVAPAPTQEPTREPTREPGRGPS